MPALIPTPFSGRITWLGLVPDRSRGLVAQALDSLELRFDGPVGETHAGLTRLSCSRVTAQYPKNTVIRNVRQLSVLGAEDLVAIAQAMGIDRLNPGLVGASLVIEGIPDFSHLPPSSRLQADGGATLVVDMENRPCTLPAKPIEAALPGHGKAFKPAAAGRRGITAWVEREGTLRLGEIVRLHVPDQPVWAHLDAVRRG
jgi:hypothetical protein